MIVYPALDLRSGRVVRLHQGDYARETRYSDDPVALARRYAAAGAQWLHVIDLDAARLGHFQHLDVVMAIVHATGLQVQCGGGVRSEAHVQALLDAGVARVTVGSVAVLQPALVEGWLQRFGAEQICVALDTRADEDGVFRLPVGGWTTPTGMSLDGVLARYAAHGGLHHLLCTDIASDGMMNGPNFALYRAIRAQHPHIALQVSGGIRGGDDVRAARAVGAAGVIVGKALLDGSATVPELLAC